MSLLKIQAPLRRLFVIRSVPASLVNCQNKRHIASSAATKDIDNKFYELRTYSIKPESVGDFVKITNEHLHLRMAHSKLIGYWMTDLGGLNEVVHIWEYDSFAQRTAVRAALGKDLNWQFTYFRHILNMMSKQDNVVMKALPNIPVQAEPRKEGGIYELRKYIMKPVGGPATFLPPFFNTLHPRIKVHEKLNYGKLMGAWMTEVGDLTAVYHLMSYESMDKRTEARNVVLSSDEAKNAPIPDSITSMTNKILLPLPFSPLQ